VTDNCVTYVSIAYVVVWSDDKLLCSTTWLSLLF